MFCLNLPFYNHYNHENRSVVNLWFVRVNKCNDLQKKIIFVLLLVNCVENYWILVVHNYTKISAKTQKTTIYYYSITQHSTCFSGITAESGYNVCVLQLWHEGIIRDTCHASVPVSYTHLYLFNHILFIIESLLYNNN